MDDAYYSPPWAKTSPVQYDPTGNQDPAGQRASVQDVTQNEAGEYVYSLVLRDRRTARPIMPPITGVPAAHVYRLRPTPGPGNDL